MFAKSNGWRRIGIVLTVAWFLYMAYLASVSFVGLKVGDGLFVLTIPSKTTLVKKGTPPKCTQAERDPHYKEGGLIPLDDLYAPRGMRCIHLLGGTDDITKIVPERHEFLWRPLLKFVFVPPILMWCFVLCGFFSIRWVAAGFKQR